MEREIQLLWTAVVLYVLAGTLAIVAVIFGRKPEKSLQGLLWSGLLVHGVAIVHRWIRLDHGPYVTMHEILSSGVFGLLFFYALAYWRYQPIRPTAAVVLPLMFVMAGWMLLTDPGDAYVPPTYDTTWLVIHILFGKVSMGGVFVALGIAGVILLRRLAFGARWFAGLPGDRRLDDLAYRFMMLAFIFDTLMLIAGAIWAQDAWGRYWAWDPLETWAFITWLVLGFALHLRVTLRPSPIRGAWLVVAVFVLSFLTFYGVPFISQVPHQGAV